MMSYLRNFKNELKAIETPSKARVLGSAYEEKTAKRKMPRRIAITPLVAIILCIVMVCGVAAAIPAIIKYTNAKYLATNNGRQLTVPEGYVGIYSADDLDTIRNDLTANYILMDDIDLSGRLFVPIGSKSKEEYFSGILNGNGYTIKGLTLDVSAVEDGYYGLFGNSRGYFFNLAVEGLMLNVVLDDPEGDVCIGTIAGSASFIGGCYVKDCKISVECKELGEYELYVGGLAGTSDYVDSCAVYADISVSGKGTAAYAALGAASTFSALTTYTVGKIDTSDANFTSLLTHGVALTLTDASMPVMLGETAMRTVIERLEAHYGDNRFYINKFKSFFVPIDTLAEFQYDKLTEANELFGYFFTEETDTNETIYVFDRRARHDDVITVHRELTKIFGSEDALLAFCNENNIKCGMISCYSFENAEDVNKDALIGFDFQDIWSEEGGIVPKIFIYEKKR